MTRVKVHFPETVDYVTETSLRISDINYGGHLGNDAVLSLMHDARVNFYKENGFSEMDIGGCGTMMIDAAISYRSEGFHGDILKVEIAVDDFSNTSFVIYYRLSLKNSTEVIAEAKTGIASYDHKKKKIVPLPDGFKAKITRS